MKSILLSIKPKYVALIASGKKTIEVRKTAPKEVPFKAYIYCSKEKKQDDIIWAGVFGDRGKWNGHVIGEFICDEVEEFHEWELSPQGKFADFERERLENFLTAACLSEEEVVRYRENLPYFKPLYGWHISDLKIYDKPKPIMQFYKPCPIKIKNCPVCELYSTYTGCCMNNIDRPPQSWQYVEELEK